MATKKSNTALKVDKLSKVFRLPNEKNSSLKQTIVNFRKRGYSEFKVLDDISFEVKKGQFFGIVGRNGSGKSTLLKLIAEIYRPTKGSVDLSGTLTPFIELGVGFNMELSGRDNVYLNGAILGLDEKEIDEIYDEIVEFAELEKFMDQKLKNYSSGMLVRLAFSVAIRAHNDILLIDEVLAVGDANVQRKCFNIFKQIKRSGKTVIFVTHDMNAVQEFCDRAMLINDGEIVTIGKSREVAIEYELLNLAGGEKELEKLNKEESLKAKQMKYGNGKAELVDVSSYKAGKKKDTFYYSDDIEIRVKAKALETLKNPRIGLVFLDDADTIIFATNTEVNKLDLKTYKSGEEISISCKIDNIFTNGDYRVSAAIASTDRQETYARVESVHQFRVEGWKMPHSKTHPEHSFKKLD